MQKIFLITIAALILLTINGAEASGIKNHPRIAVAECSNSLRVAGFSSITPEISLR